MLFPTLTDRRWHLTGMFGTGKTAILLSCACAWLLQPDEYRVVHIVSPLFRYYGDKSYYDQMMVKFYHRMKEINLVFHGDMDGWSPHYMDVFGCPATLTLRVLDQVSGCQCFSFHFSRPNNHFCLVVC